MGENLFTHIMLFGWPLVVIILFLRTSLQVALTVSILAGYLLLPARVGVNFPLLPFIDKTLIPSAAAAMMALFIVRHNATTGTITPEPGGLPGWLPRLGSTRLLLLVLVAGAFMTSWVNGDRLFYGTRSLPGLGAYDAFSTTLTTLVGLIPFFLARKFLAHPDSHRTVLLIFAVAGLLYSLPSLYEVRMSPQLNKMFYGFFQSDWRQGIRGNGFRPLVFLNHGLVLALFLSSALLATLGYFRAEQRGRRWFFLAAAIWLMMALVLAKSLGALLTAIFLIPVFLFFGARLQLLSAAVIAVVVLSYPVLRGADLVPVDRVVTLVEKISPARAQSFQFRLTNEDRLLDKASQRARFGWGGWGRARVFDGRGRDITNSDGHWVLTIGEGGWTRYIGEFGLLATPIILLTLRRRRYEITLATSGLCLVLAANLLDLIPNAGLTPVTWLMAGALVGRLELQRITSARQPTPPQVEMARASPYARPRPVRAPQPERLAYSRQTRRSPRPTGAET